MRPRSKGDVSLVALAVLALVALSIIVANVIFAGQEAIRMLWEAESERVAVYYTGDGYWNVTNVGPVTVRIVSVWIIEGASHTRVEVPPSEGTLGSGSSLRVYAPAAGEVKAVTERGRVFVGER